MTNGCIGITVIQNVNVIELEKVLVFPIQIGFSNTNWFFQYKLVFPIQIGFSNFRLEKSLGFPGLIGNSTGFPKDLQRTIKAPEIATAVQLIRISDHLMLEFCERPIIVSLYLMY